jgi:hypothetical protein
MPAGQAQSLFHPKFARLNSRLVSPFAAEWVRGNPGRVEGSWMSPPRGGSPLPDAQAESEQAVRSSRAECLWAPFQARSDRPPWRHARSRTARVWLVQKAEQLAFFVPNAATPSPSAVCAHFLMVSFPTHLRSGIIRGDVPIVALMLHDKNHWGARSQAGDRK